MFKLLFNIVKEPIFLVMLFPVLLSLVINHVDPFGPLIIYGIAILVSWIKDYKYMRGN